MNIDVQEGIRHRRRPPHPPESLPLKYPHPLALLDRLVLTERSQTAILSASHSHRRIIVVLELCQHGHWFLAWALDAGAGRLCKGTTTV